MTTQQVPNQIKTYNNRVSRNYLSSPNDSSLSRQPEQAKEFRPRPNHQKKYNHSKSRQERDVSPTISVESMRQDQFMYQLEHSLVNENRNLQEHNAFLVAQIKTLYERQKRYVSALKRAKRQNQELREINLQLQLQMQQITKHTLKEIDKIQRILQNQRSLLDDDIRLSSQSSDKKSEALGWETETTLNQNLEELKKKVTSYQLKQTFRSNFSFEKSPREEKTKDQMTNFPKEKEDRTVSISSNRSTLHPPDELFIDYLPPSSIYPPPKGQKNPKSQL